MAPLYRISSDGLKCSGGVVSRNIRFIQRPIGDFACDLGLSDPP